MCVSRQLHIVPRVGCGGSGTRLMGEQYLGARAGRRAAQGRRGIALLSWVKMMGAIVSHSSEDERLAVVRQHDMLVFEHLQAKPPQLLGPCALPE